MNEPISPKPPASACEMMQEQHQWQKKGWPLVVLNLGLLATSTVLYWLHPSFLRAENWHGLALCWLGGLIISAGLGLLIGKLRRPSILHSARALDESLGAKNRLEMAVALSSATDPIALAQREETDGFVKILACASTDRVLGAGHWW